MSNKIAPILQALDTITGTGNFHTYGDSPFFLPELIIQGLGEVAFPLLASQAEQIIATAEAAPYGKGTDTVYDDTVRKCWQVDASQWEIRSPQWKKFLKKALHDIGETLGIRGEISALPYKLLIYGKGGHFKPHKDTEKLDSMFGTMIVCLPSAHAGGQLFIRHDGQEHAVDFSKGDHTRDFQYVGFFADCEHEVVPVKSGFRCCLVYNLKLVKGDPALLNLAITDQARTLLPALQSLTKMTKSDLRVILLEHSYTEANFSFTNLKGNDQVKAHALMSAAQEAGLNAHLALLTWHQSGELSFDYEDDSYYGRGGRGKETSEEMGEILEESITLSHWCDKRNKSVDFGEYHITEEQIITKEILTDGEPDEKESEGYTGNAGCTMDYWYRRAALVLWPMEHNEEILCRYNFTGACCQLESKAGKVKGNDLLDFQKLAQAVIAHSPDKEPEPWDGKHENFLQAYQNHPLRLVFTALATQGDSDLLKNLLSRLTPAAFWLMDASLWAKWINAFGIDVATDVSQILMKEIPLPRGPLFQILAALGQRPEAGELVAKIIPELATDRAMASSVEEAVAMIAASRLTLAKPIQKALWYFLTKDSSIGFVRDILGPALTNKHFIKKVEVPDSLAAKLLAHATNILRQETQSPLLPYPDWTRPVPPLEKNNPSTWRYGVATDFGLLEKLHVFMKSPEEATHRFSCDQSARSYLENYIKNNKLDLDCTTDKGKRPYTLVCQKNSNSHQELVKIRQGDEKLLATLHRLGGHSA